MILSLFMADLVLLCRTCHFSPVECLAISDTQIILEQKCYSLYQNEFKIRLKIQRQTNETRKAIVRQSFLVWIKQTIPISCYVPFLRPILSLKGVQSQHQKAEKFVGEEVSWKLGLWQARKTIKCQILKQQLVSASFLCFILSLKCL